MIEGFYTKRLQCRRIKEKDVGLITAWKNSEDANGEYLTSEKISLKDNLEKFKNNNFWNKKSKSYVVELKENSLPIGIIKYWTKINDTSCALMTVKIATPSYRKNGFGTELQKALIRELFKKFKFKSIEMYTDINNIAQQKCLKKLDFDNIKTESYEDAGLIRQGYLYQLTKEKYEKSGVHIYYYE